VIEAIAGKDGETSGVEPLPDLMEQVVSIGRPAAAEMDSEAELALGRDSRPEPYPLGILFDFSDQLIQL
jgi:hypothetical protein